MLDITGTTVGVGDCVVLAVQIWDGITGLKTGTVEGVNKDSVAVKVKRNCYKYNAKTGKHDIPIPFESIVVASEVFVVPQERCHAV